MTVELAALGMTVIGAIVAVAVAWGRASRQNAELEKDVGQVKDKVDALALNMAGLLARISVVDREIESIKQSYANALRRVGDAESQVAVVRDRTETAARGVPIPRR